MNRSIAASALLLSLAPSCGSEPPGEVGKTTGALSGALATIDWSMPDMFGPDFDGDGIKDLIPVAPSNPALSAVVGNPMRPSAWKVTLNGCGSTPAVNYSWDVSLPVFAGMPPIVQHVNAGASCSTVFQFPNQGTFNVKLTTQLSDGTTATATRDVVVKNYLIVSIGDSIASGEGNPDANGAGIFVDGTLPRWADERCHRSARSGPAMAAQMLEDADPHTSVRFVSLACSGAGIDVGLLGPYDGEQPPSGIHPLLPPQIDAVKGVVCPIIGAPPGGVVLAPCAPIDALLVSIGANDAGFGKVVETCAVPHNDCASNDFPFSGFTDEIAGDINALPTKYNALDAKIRSTLNVRQTYITEYPDATHNDYGAFCDEIRLVGAVQDQAIDAVGALGEAAASLLPDGVMESHEVSWAHDSVINPLNSNVLQAAQAHGWHGLSIAADFATHGYCANNHWLVRYEESKARQANQDGTLHPNASGTADYAQHIAAGVQRFTTPGVPSLVGFPRPNFYTEQFDAGDNRGYTSDQDWAGGYFKAQCNAGDVVAGISAQSIYIGPGLRAHSALCASGNVRVDSGTLASTERARWLWGADDRADLGTGDWDPGYYKAECGKTEAVTGLAQSADGNLKMASILCTSTRNGLGSDENSCSTLVFSNTGDNRVNTSSGEWANLYAKNECGTAQILKGVSRNPSSGEIHSILCCPVQRFAPENPPAQPPARSTACGVLTAGQGLAAGTSQNILLSCDGRFQLSMEDAGSLALYQLTPGPIRLWSTSTDGAVGNTAVMQADGRLTVGNPRGPVTWWSTPTANNPGAYLALQNDGNLVIYPPSGPPALWATNTCCR
jgi:hypothetical protein